MKRPSQRRRRYTRDLAAKSASAAVFACLDGMYSEDGASATLEFREEVE
jgi:hypothetical protein